MTIPAVSVLIPVRNGERFLREALAGVVANDTPSREIIIVDDGSTDGTRAILDEARRGDNRIVAVSQPASGLVAALERGRRYARAPLIARLDADDIAYPDRFARQVAAFEADPGLVLLGSAMDRIDESGRVVGKIVQPLDPADVALRLREGNVFVHSSVMMRRSAVQTVGGYRSFFLAAEDYDLWLRLAEQGRVANLRDRLGAYRLHDASVTSQARLRQLFSTALARRAAETRRAGRPDPSQGREEPIDLEAEIARFEPFAAEIGTFRALAFADVSTFAHRRPTLTDIGALTSTGLAPLERKLAQRALLNMLRLNAVPASFSRWSALKQAYRLGPLRATRLLAGSLRESAGP